MRTIIHDIENLKLSSYDVLVSGDCNNCVGCFNCWVKHPFECIFKDKIKNNGRNLYECDELIIISKCVYGCYSSSVKRILERSISYVKPFFTLRDGEVHHDVRSDKKIDFKIYFYGDVTESDKEIAYALANANQKNLNTKRPEVMFFKTKEEIEEII